MTFVMYGTTLTFPPNFRVKKVTINYERSITGKLRWEHDDRASFADATVVGGSVLLCICGCHLCMLCTYSTVLSAEHVRKVFLSIVPYFVLYLFETYICVVSFCCHIIFISAHVSTFPCVRGCCQFLDGNGLLSCETVSCRWRLATDRTCLWKVTKDQLSRGM